MESINLIVQIYVWKVKYQTTTIFTSNLMKNRTLKEMMDALFISSGLHKTCVEELSLLQKGSTKSFVLLERKRFCLIRIHLFHMRNGKKGNPT